MANRPPPVQARRQRNRFCLLKTIFTMELLGLVATMPFWRSELTHNAVNFGEYGIKHLNDSNNVIISKLQKRIAAFAESTTEASSPTTPKILIDAAKEVKIYENGLDHKNVTKRIDGKEMTNEADKEVLNMAGTIYPYKIVVHHDEEYKDDFYYDEPKGYEPVQQESRKKGRKNTLHYLQRVAKQSQYSTTYLIVVFVVAVVLLAVIIIILWCCNCNRNLSLGHSNPESGEELIALDAESIACN